ncbi:MAG: S8 family serine peptidase [Chitinophagales bacterium]
MKKLLVVVFKLYCLAVFGFDSDPAAIPGQYIIQFRAGFGSEVLQGSPFHLHKILSSRMGIALVDDLTAQPVEQALRQLYAMPAIAIAQCNHRVQQRDLWLPNDPRFNEQWNLRNSGQSKGLVGADISATLAYTLNRSPIAKTGDTLVVAVIDNTFDMQHEDLNYFYNVHEIPLNGIDDDGNGFIDDYHGWNVFDNNDSVFVFPSAHSTHCAGIVGAVANNGKGVAGVCPAVKILAIAGSSETESEVVEAYDYVVEMRRLFNQTNGAKGAFIVSTSSSFGVNNGKPVNFPIWCAMYDSMGAQGVLSAGATANLGINVETDHDIPSECPSKWLIAVTNTTRSDDRNSFAAYGSTSIDLGAPGTQILSTISNNNYGLMTGTSMATPHVAGAVAAVFAAACPDFINNYKNFPDSFALQVKQYIMNGVDTLTTMQQTVSKGRLNVFIAVQQIMQYNCNNCAFSAAAVGTPAFCYGDTNGIVTGTATGLNSYQFLWNNGSTSTTINPARSGVYWATVSEFPGNCTKTVVTTVYEPQPIVFDSVRINAISAGSGSFVVYAKAGKDALQYALDTGTFSDNRLLTTPLRGAHIVHARNAFGCVADTTVFIDFATGINELTSSTWSSTPNPANQQLTVTFPTPFTGAVSITDVTGAVVRTEHLAEIKNWIMAVDDICAGWYVIQPAGNKYYSPMRILIAH